MSMFPHKTEEEHHRDAELSRWHPKEGLQDNVLKSFEELKEKYPGEIITKHTKDESYAPFIDPFNVYIIEKDKSLPRYVAYDCTQCGGIVSATPRIEAKNDIKALAGSSRLEYYCKKCDIPLGETIFRQG